MIGTRALDIARSAAIVAASLGGSAAWATDHHIQPDGSGDFATIGAATGSLAVVSGDTIILHSGTYTGAGNRDISYHGKAIVIRSDTGNPADCIIDCQGLGRGFQFVNDEDLDSELHGVTVTNGLASGANDNVGGAVRCGKDGFPPITPHRYGSPTISDCIFDGNSAAIGGAVSCTTSSDPMILDCRFLGNTLTLGLGSHYGAGLYCFESSPTVVDCVFDGNEVTSLLSGAGGGVYCESSLLELRRCVFSDNTANVGGAVAINQADPLIEACTFFSNSATTNGGGMYAYGTFTNPTVTKCTLYGNSAGGGGAGIASGGFAQFAVDHTIIAMSTQGEAVYCYGGGGATISSCDVYGNVGGPGCVSGQMGSSNNFAAYPGFCSPSDEDFSVRDQSACAAANSPCSHEIGAWGVGCSGALTYEACPTGPTDFATVQAAIDGCLAGDTVELCDATFVGAGNRDLEYNGKAITIRSQSGDASSCIIDCGGTLAQPHRGFIFRAGDGAGARLQAVTITHGYAIDAPPRNGGGILFDAGTPVIADCVITDNHSDWGGGGMACTNGAAPTLDTCTLSGNTSVSFGGGLLCEAGSSATVRDCTFTGNAAGDDGGGMASFALVQIEDSTFQGNTTIAHGGGLTLMGSADNSTVLRCLFRNNVAGEPAGWGAGGGLSALVGNVQVERCTFDENSAVSFGGGAYVQVPSGSMVLTECTFYGNSAPNGGGISGTGSADNTIIARSRQGSAVAGTLNITCCDIFGNVGGPGAVAGQIGLNGNIALDPVFCDPVDDDFTIVAASPCAPFSPPNPICDLIGAWPVGCTVSCAADVDDSGVIDVADLLALLGVWGQTGVPEDANDDGIVDVADLLALLGTWGTCG